jgi:hypothetical protein
MKQFFKKLVAKLFKSGKGLLKEKVEKEFLPLIYNEIDKGVDGLKERIDSIWKKFSKKYL